MLPSGICNTFKILATVPVLKISFALGSSIFSSFCATTPINLLKLLESLINLIDFARDAVIGITTPGKSTVFLKDKIGKVSGNFSLLISISSSGVIKGINSAFSSISFTDKLSILNNLFFDISYLINK